MIILPKEFYESKKPQLFDRIREESLQKILACSVMQDHESGKLLVQQGDMPEGVFLVIEGTVKTHRYNVDGEEATIRMLEAGDTCMEAVLFMGGPSPVSVQTMTKCKLIMIPERIVKSQILMDERFAFNIIRIITRHYKNAIQQIEAINIKSPLQRVGYFMLTRHLDAGHDNLEFTLPFKKQTIANYLGITPETFSRTLKQMKDMGIDVDGDVIQMKDSFALCHFCDSETTSVCDDFKKNVCKFRSISANSVSKA